MPIYDYECKNGHKTESLEGVGVENILCPLCGKLANRKSVYPFTGKLAHTKDTIGKKYKRFQEASAEIDYTCNKFESETNAKVPSLGLWEKAKRRVANGEHRGI